MKQYFFLNLGPLAKIFSNLLFPRPHNYMPVILVGEFLLALDIVSLNILDSTISRAMEYH